MVKENPRRGLEKQSAQNAGKSGGPDVGITSGNEPALVIGGVPSRESLTAPEKRKVKIALVKVFKPIDLGDDSYDTLIPASLEAVGELLDTGYLPSMARGGFITHFPRIELAFNALEEDPLHENEPIPFYLQPLIAACAIAQRHGLLAELNLHRQLNLPNTDPELWDHLIKPRNKRYLRQHGFQLDDVRAAGENSQNYSGILIGIKGFAEGFVDEDIPYDRITAIMGLGTERVDLASSAFLDVNDSHPALHTDPYMIEGKSISLVTADRAARRTPERPRVVSQSVFVGLKGYGSWKILTDPQLGIDKYWEDEENNSMELVEGYLNAPSYQMRTPTGVLDLPAFGQVHVITNQRRSTIDPLLTQRDILTFQERHKDKYPQWLADKVRAALFRPYRSVARNISLQLPEISPALSADEQKGGLHDIFTDWKAAKLHLWHFDRDVGNGKKKDELGVAASTIRQAIDRHRLVKMQGLNLAGQDFLTDFLTELHTEIEPEIHKQESASLINEYLHHFKDKATVSDSGATIRLPSGEIIEVSIYRPSGTKKGGVYLKREEDESHIEVRAVSPEKDTIEFVTASHTGREPQVTEKDRWLFLDALKAVTVLTFLPKMIIDIFGSYQEFQTYLQKYNAEWNDAEQPPLYNRGLSEMVGKLQGGEEDATFGMLLARRFGNLAPLSNEALTTMKTFDRKLFDVAA